MTAMKKLLPIIVIPVLFAISCGEKIKPGTVEVKRQAVTGVTTAPVTLKDVDSYYETAGTVKAKAASIVAARTTGAVMAVRVKEGDRVVRGEELVVLDDRDMEQSAAAAESGYKEAQAAAEEAAAQTSLADVTYRRYKKLSDDNVITRQEMDQVETQKRVADLAYERSAQAVKRAKARFDEARINRAFARITAPYAGIVTEKRVEPGSMATPGTPLLVIEDTSQYRVYAYVNETLLPKIKTGMPVTVMPAGDKARLTGTIGEVVPAVDPATRSFPVKVYLNGGAFRSGVYVRIIIPEGTRKALLVPRSAVVEKGQLSGVYAVDDQGVMTYRIVKTGRTYGDDVEVVSGLAAGERIAVSGLDHALDGGLVRQ